MYKAWICFLAMALISCSDTGEGNDMVLSQPPFDKLTDSIRSAPQEADLYYRRGLLLYQNNQPTYAARDIRKAWELSPRESYALSLTTLLKQKHADSALLFLQEASRKIPGSIALQVGLARGYQNKGEMDKAQTIVDDILARYPGQLDALIIKSEILDRQNDKKSALAYLERAYSLAPTDLSLAYDLAYAYAEAKHPGAVALTDSLINRRAPEFEKAYYTKGIYFSNTGNTAEALKNFDEAIRINYNFLDAYRDKGNLLLEQGKNDQALKTFQLALKIAPAAA